MREYRIDENLINKHPIFNCETKFVGQALVVTHQNDEVIPTLVTDAFVAAFNADEIIIPNCLHNVESLSPKELSDYPKGIIAWLS